MESSDRHCVNVAPVAQESVYHRSIALSGRASEGWSSRCEGKPCQGLDRHGRGGYRGSAWDEKRAAGCIAATESRSGASTYPWILGSAA